jgi:hypothetical protein
VKEFRVERVAGELAELLEFFDSAGIEGGLVLPFRAAGRMTVPERH